MAEGGQGSTKEAVKKIVESMLYCSKCEKYTVDTFAYIACDHVICKECIPKVPSTTCPLCGKNSTQMNVAADAKFVRLRELTAQLATLMQIKCDQKKVATNTTRAVPSSDSDRNIKTKNMRNKSRPTVEVKDKSDMAETSGVIESNKSATVISTATETSVIPDENNDLPRVGLTSPKPTSSGTPKVIKLNRSKDQAQLNSETPADKTVAENHQTPHRRKTSNVTLQKTDQDAKEGNERKDVPSPMKSARNVKKMGTPQTEKRNCRGETPLHVACIRGDFRRVQSLIAEGARVNSVDNAHWSPLHEAAQRGYVDIARSLIAAGGLTNVPGVGNTTPLHDAVEHNRVEMVQLLIQLGADTEARNSNGKKPIDMAQTEVMRAAFAVKGMAPPAVKHKPSTAADRKMFVFAAKPTWLAHPTQLSVVAKLLGQKIANKLTREVTHVVAEMVGDNVCKPSASILHAMLLGATIISDSWILESAEKDCVIDPLLFEINGTTNFPTSDAPRRARLNACNQLPGLFDNCSFFLRHITEDYVSGDLTLTKLELVNLIKAGGGTVLSREPNPENISKKEVLCPYHAQAGGPLEQCTHYIIYQAGDEKIKYNMQHVKALPTRWLVDCLESFALLDHVPYL